jgi:hypothetical protein
MSTIGVDSGDWAEEPRPNTLLRRPPPLLGRPLPAVEAAGVKESTIMESLSHTSEAYTRTKCMQATAHSLANTADALALTVRCWSYKRQGAKLRTEKSVSRHGTENNSTHSFHEPPPSQGIGGSASVCKGAPRPHPPPPRLFRQGQPRGCPMNILRMRLCATTCCSISRYLKRGASPHTSRCGLKGTHRL